ncbi:Ig-like domain-containing protein [Pseudogemmobacter sp. W21_MBD1_M6]|uniref:Ig-like domain-containing protein n=1 Tax=Pseudogemmobacter sp. W21_MBD1_M6 TaxID=3240271 RepID=UPI003F9AE3E4
MQAINFIVRGRVSGIHRGAVAGDENNAISLQPGSDVSLNLNQHDVVSYVRQGSVLEVTLIDGRVVVLENFFPDGGAPACRLFISSDGQLSEVIVSDLEGQAQYAQYGPSKSWGKWDGGDDLYFADNAVLSDVIEASEHRGLGGIFGAVASGGAGLLASAAGAVGAVGATAAAGGAALIAANYLNTDVTGSSAARTAASVNDPETDVVVSGADAAQVVTITGQAQAGSSVSVTIGDVTLTTTAGGDGYWAVTFEGENLPADGDYSSTVLVVEPEGANVDLDGPVVVIDTTAPDVDVSEGVVAVDDFVNADAHDQGVTIGGTTEPGATVIVTIGNESQTTTAGGDGSWVVVFSPDQVPGGEHETEVLVTTVDAQGNSATVTETILIDTIADPITIGASMVGIDGTVNLAEHDGGVVVTGTSTAGATLDVTLGDKTLQTVVTENGTWSVAFDAADVATGEYDATITATTTDVHGNMNTVSSIVHIDTVGAVSLNSGSIAGNNIINKTEAEDGVTLTGTTQVGSTVAVQIGSVTHPATVAEDGTWSVVFANGDLGLGEYDAGITVTATDTAGNITVSTGTVHVDTVGMVGFDANLSGGDTLINASEADAGVTLTGTAQAGSVVEVTLGNVTHTVTADESGTWAAVFVPSEIPEGVYQATLTARATDTAGNINIVTGTLDVDTLSFVEVFNSAVEGNGVINKTEAADGITLTGSTQPGATVDVTFQGVTRAATVANDGSWTVDFTASEVPVGEYDATITAVSTSENGNVSSSSGTVRVDTLSNVTFSTTPVEGNDVISQTEAANGVILTGTSEPGSSVEVKFGSVTRAAVVAQDGSWTASFTAGDIPAGEYDAPLVATATDSAGNIHSVTDTVHVDTVANVAFGTATIETDNIINKVEADNGVTLTGTSEPGSTVQVSFGTVSHMATVAPTGAWTATFAASEITSGDYTADLKAIATDAAGNATTVTHTVRVDTLNEVAFGSGRIAGDNIVNAAEAEDGIVLNGSTTPGSTVSVKFGNVTHAATVDTYGNWTVGFGASDIAQGEYSTTLVATSTDAVGNVSTATQSVDVDTVAGHLTLGAAVIEGDDIINKVEASDGVVLTGTATPGAIVNVTLGDVTRPVVADVDGSWSANFSAANIPADTESANILATMTDAAGNTVSVTDTVKIDTVVQDFALSATPIETDTIINAVEASNGVILSGTVEPGSRVSVQLDGVTRLATVAADGSWTAGFAASQIRAGEYLSDIKVTATDSANNTSVINSSVKVDTLVRDLASSATPVEGDNIINAAEAKDGFMLTGKTEVGSTVNVTFEGTTHAATVAANGNWSVSFDASEIPGGDYTSTVMIVATDLAANTREITQTLDVDTIAPDNPMITAVNDSGVNGVRGINIESTEDAISIFQIAPDGTTTQVAFRAFDNPEFNDTYIAFNTVVPDGSQLVITSEDAAHNTSGTLLVLDSGADFNMSNMTLTDHGITEIDLSYADGFALTITEEQLLALSQETDTVTIHGGHDGGVQDTVVVSGASATGQNVSANGQDYDGYSLGNAAGNLLIDDDIHTVII